VVSAASIETQQTSLALKAHRAFNFEQARRIEVHSRATLQALMQVDLHSRSSSSALSGSAHRGDFSRIMQLEIIDSRATNQ